MHSPLFEQLAKKYLDILGNTPSRDIYRQSSHGLSGVFLAAPHEAYATSNHRLMIVGQEPKRWLDKKCELAALAAPTLCGVRRAMNASITHNHSPPGTSKFRQFYKKTSSRICCDSSNPREAAIWSNQFAISHKRGSPTKSRAFRAIKELSLDLLRAQFEVLQPHTVIFTVGPSRDKYLKEIGNYYDSHVIQPRRLWRFTIDGVQCIRICHPRATVEGKNRWEAEAIRLAAS